MSLKQLLDKTHSMKILHLITSSQLSSLRMCGVSVLFEVSKAFWRNPTRIISNSFYYLLNNLLTKSIQRKWIGASNNVLMQRRNLIKLVKRSETVFLNPSITWTPQNTSFLAHLTPHTPPKKRKSISYSVQILIWINKYFLSAQWIRKMN